MAQEPLVTGNLEHDQAIIDARLAALCDFVGDNDIPEIDWAVISFLRANLTLLGTSHENVHAFAVCVYWLGRYAESLQRGKT